MEIRQAELDDIEGCVAALALLPEFFTPSTHDEVRTSMIIDRAVVAVDGATVLGFVLNQERHPRSAEIIYAAVHPGSDAKGLGRWSCVAYSPIWAPPASREWKLRRSMSQRDTNHFVATRRFWESHGFIQVDCIDPLPGWEPGNPAAIYVKALTDT